MENLINLWGCGKVFKRSKEDKVDFIIRKFYYLADKVIPLFQSIPLQASSGLGSVKSKDFSYFVKAVVIIKAKGHLTTYGLNELRKIKQGMNKVI